MGQGFGGGVFDDGSFEEVSVGVGVEAELVGEGEVSEVLGADQAVLDGFIGFGDGFRHVGHVPVAEVGAHEGSDLGAERD